MFHTIFITFVIIYIIWIFGAKLSLIIAFKLAAIAASLILGIIALSGGDLPSWYLFVSVCLIFCPVTAEGWNESLNDD